MFDYRPASYEASVNSSRTQTNFSNCSVQMNQVLHPIRKLEIRECPARDRTIGLCHLTPNRTQCSCQLHSRLSPCLQHGMFHFHGVLEERQRALSPQEFRFYPPRHHDQLCCARPFFDEGRQSIAVFTSGESRCLPVIRAMFTSRAMLFLAQYSKDR